jgi:hypothetical protein
VPWFAGYGGGCYGEERLLKIVNHPSQPVHVLRSKKSRTRKRIGNLLRGAMDLEKAKILQQQIKRLEDEIRSEEVNSKKSR